MSLLEIRDLTIDFPHRRGDFVAVRGVSLHVDPGEILGIVGESGAGKSTIGNAVVGLLQRPGRIAGGTVHLAGERIDDLDDKALRRLRGRRIGMIFQDPLTSLDPLQTVEQQLVETIDYHLRLGKEASRKRAVDLLGQVGILEPDKRIKLYPHQFSGGMRQRIVIALAICAEPELIIADEPTTALDVSVQSQVLALLRRIVEERKVGMILVTHDMGVIAENADRVAVMYRGNLVEMGDKAQVLGAPRHDYTRSLLSAVPRADIRMPRLAQVGHSDARAEAKARATATTAWVETRHVPAENIALRLDGVSKSFVIKRSLFPHRRESFLAVSDVSLTIRPGEVFGLVGESGSGKSTLARMVAGLLHPDDGRICFNETELSAASKPAEWAAVRRRFQMIFQDPYSSLNPRMRVADIVAEPITFLGIEHDKSEVRRMVSRLLELVEMPANAAEKYPHEFSGGQRQRISIARALATSPGLLICDEPTSALDVSIQAQILNLLRDLQARLKLTILFISHDLPVIRQMCDRIGVMRSGRMLEIGETEAFFQSPSHDYSRELLSLMPHFRFQSNDGRAMGPADV